MAGLVRCARCARHVRLGDVACPFCALERVTVAVSTLSLAAALVACEGDKKTDAPRESAPVGDRSKPVYGGPMPPQNAKAPPGPSVDDYQAQQLLNAGLSDGSAPPVAPPPSALASALADQQRADDLKNALTVNLNGLGLADGGKPDAAAPKKPR
jgi:hypothetical protein